MALRGPRRAWCWRSPGGPRRRAARAPRRTRPAPAPGASRCADRAPAPGRSARWSSRRPPAAPATRRATPGPGSGPRATGRPRRRSRGSRPLPVVRRSGPPPRRPQPPLAVDQLLVRRLDREEPRQRALARRIGVVLLREPPVGRPDLVQGRVRPDPERPERVSLGRHRRSRVVRRASPARRPAPARTTATASATTRPCGSMVGGRW